MSNPPANPDPQRYIKYYLNADKMEQMTRERTKCLLLWIGSLQTFADNGVIPKLDHFKDGVMTSRILKNVIDPDYFGDLNDSLKESTALVKVVEKMKKYLTRQVSFVYFNFSVNFMHECRIGWRRKTPLS